MIIGLCIGNVLPKINGDIMMHIMDQVHIQCTYGRMPSLYCSGSFNYILPKNFLQTKPPDDPW